MVLLGGYFWKWMLFGDLLCVVFCFLLKLDMWIGGGLFGVLFFDWCVVGCVLGVC